MKHILISMSVLALLCFTISCNNAKPLSSVIAGGSEMLYASQWNLAELNGTAVTSGKAYLLFSPGQINRVAGNAGCNKLNGTMELTGVNFIKFSPLATTRMACDPSIREAEFTEALGKVNNWSIINNQLLLQNGKILLAKLNGTTVESANLAGTWELNYISGQKIAFKGLYPQKKPTIIFDLIKNELSGNSSCNSFSSNITINGTNITIADPRSTKMACQGGGEQSFFAMLKKVNRYAVSDVNTLTFIIDDIAVMRFSKK